MTKPNCSIREAKRLIHLLETNSLSQLAASSPQFEATCKQLITLCNSVCIVLLQYKLNDQASEILQIGLKAKENLAAPWPGTALSLALQGLIHFRYFLHSKLSPTVSLKWFLQAEKQLLFSPRAELTLTVNLGIFMAFWRLKRVKDAARYLESASLLVNRLINVSENAIFSQLSVENIYGLVAMCLSVVTGVLERDWSRAVNLCEQSKDQLDSPEILVRPLMTTLIEKIRRLSVHSTPKTDFLLTPDFEHIYYLSAVLPFKAKWTPQISTDELVREHTKALKKQSLHIADSRRSSAACKKHSPRRKSVLHKKGQAVPWWENSKLMKQVMKWPDPRFRSEPRGSSVTSALHRIQSSCQPTHTEKLKLFQRASGKLGLLDNQQLFEKLRSGKAGGSLSQREFDPTQCKPFFKAASSDLTALDLFDML